MSQLTESQKRMFTSTECCSYSSTTLSFSNHLNSCREFIPVAIIDFKQCQAVTDYFQNVCDYIAFDVYYLLFLKYYFSNHLSGLMLISLFIKTFRLVFIIEISIILICIDFHSFRNSLCNLSSR